MNLPRDDLHGLTIASLPLLLISMTVLKLASCQSIPPAGTFCSKTLTSATMSACRSPPTLNSFRIQEYLGTFYEIGSTANYKLSNELGTICNKADQTLSGGSATLKVEFSGLEVLSNDATTGIAQISATASSVCSKARQICGGMAPGGGIAQALMTMTMVRDDLARQRQMQQAMTLTRAILTVQGAMGMVESEVDALTGGVRAMQVMNGQLNGVGKASTGEVAALRSLVSVALQHAQSIGGVLRGNLTTAGSEVAALASSLVAAAGSAAADGGMLTAAVATMGSVVETLTAAAADMETELGRSAAQWADMIDGSAARAANSTATTQVTLAQQPTAPPGRMVANLTTAATPAHWDILVAEGRNVTSGGYNTILVYMCAEAMVSDNLLMFSRSRQLPGRTINRLLGVAARFGILTDCEAPFLPSLQPTTCT